MGGIIGGNPLQPSMGAAAPAGGPTGSTPAPGFQLAPQTSLKAPATTPPVEPTAPTQPAGSAPAGTGLFGLPSWLMSASADRGGGPMGGRGPGMLGALGFGGFGGGMPSWFADAVGGGGWTIGAVPPGQQGMPGIGGGTGGGPQTTPLQSIKQGNYGRPRKPLQVDPSVSATPAPPPPPAVAQGPAYPPMVPQYSWIPAPGESPGGSGGGGSFGITGWGAPQAGAGVVPLPNGGFTTVPNLQQYWSSQYGAPYGAAYGGPRQQYGPYGTMPPEARVR